MLTKLLTFVGITWVSLVHGVQSDSSCPTDPCACKVVNYTAPGPSCKCAMPGNPNLVPAFDASVATFPDGLPTNGKCNKPGCDTEEARPCTLKPMRVHVTAAACARDCTGHSSATPGVNWDWGIAGWGGNAPSPLNGNQTFGTIVSYTLLPPQNTSAAECDGKEVSAELKFKNKDGTTAFFIKFVFGCGKCASE